MTAPQDGQYRGLGMRMDLQGCTGLLPLAVPLNRTTQRK